jgi:hypothetical protein
MSVEEIIALAMKQKVTQNKDLSKDQKSNGAALSVSLSQHF